MLRYTESVALGVCGVHAGVGDEACRQATARAAEHIDTEHGQENARCRKGVNHRNFSAEEKNSQRLAAC